MWVSSWATILARWMAPRVVLWSVGYARPTLVQLEDLRVSYRAKKDIIRLWGKLWRMSCVGHVKVDEY